MIHIATETNPIGDHYAVSVSGKSASDPTAEKVLVQLQQDGNQARIALTPREACHMAQLLLAAANKVFMANG